MTEATGCEAQTIHRLLEVKRESGRRAEPNPDFSSNMRRIRLEADVDDYRRDVNGGSAADACSA